MDADGRPERGRLAGRSGDRLRSRQDLSAGQRGVSGLRVGFPIDDTVRRRFRFPDLRVGGARAGAADDGSSGGRRLGARSVPRSRVHLRAGVARGPAVAARLRVPAGVRAAGGHPRRRHAAGRDPRRRRPARDHPRRRLLPVLHLPPAALGVRARPVGAARLPVGGALPLHLRRDPQPVGDVAAALPADLRALPRPAPRSRPRSRRRASGRASSARCSATWARSRGSSPPTTTCAHSIALYNDARHLVLELYRARRDEPWRVPTEELYLLLRAGEVVPPEVFLAKGRGYLEAVHGGAGPHPDNSRVIVVGRLLRAAAAGPHQDHRARRLLHRRRRLPARQPVDSGGRADRRRPARGPRRRRSSATRCKTSVLYEPDPAGKRRLMKERVTAAGADGIIFAARELLRSGPARPADAAGRGRGRRASRASPSSTPRTPASSSSSASRPGPSRTRSSCGEGLMSPIRGRSRRRGPQGPLDGAAEGDDRRATTERLEAGTRDAATRSSTPSCRAISPS